MKLSDFLMRDAIITDLEATTKEGAIREIVSRVQDAGHLTGVDPESLTRALLEREGLASTAIGRGVAVPHAELPYLDRVTGSIALAPNGVEFNAVDGKPVDVLVTLFFPPMAGRTIRARRPERTLPRLRGRGAAFRGRRLPLRLRQCRTREEVIGLVVEADRERPEIVTTQL